MALRSSFKRLNGLCILSFVLGGAAGTSFGATTETLSLNTNVGNGLQLYANTPNQLVQVLVSGGDSINGEDLNVQINNAMTGPTLISADFQTGTIFATNNNFGATPPDKGFITTPEPGLGTPAADQSRFIFGSTTTGSGFVTATGLLATLSISTTGLTAGSSFTVKMLGTINGDSDFASVDGTVFSFPSNSITLIDPVPEPASLSLLAAGSMVLLKRRRREATA